MKRARLLLLGAYVAVYLLPLGVRPLFVPDEYRYAEIPREMLAGGDWVVPRLAGFRYFEKPVLSYWVSAGSLALLGENAFGLRLPSALAAGLCAWLTAFVVRRAGEDARASLLAAGVLLTSGLFFGVATYKTLDSIFTLGVTASLVCAFLAGEGDGRRRLALWALAGAAAGAAFLTKGLLGFALPAIVLAPYLTWERRWRDALRHSWIAPVTAIGVVLPWSLAVARSDADFWPYFFWNEHVRRFASDDAQHVAPFWYYAPVLLGCAMPWTPLWPAAVVGLRARPTTSLVRLALCGLVSPFLLFSIARGKLAIYLLPCFPALAILVAVGLRAELARSGRWLRAGLRVLAVAVGGGTLGVVMLWLLSSRLIRVYQEGELARLILVALAASLASLAWIAAARSRRPEHVLALATLAATPLFLAYPFVVPDLVLERKAPGALLARHADRLTEGALVASAARLAPAVCWHARRDDVLVLGGIGELRYGASRPDSHSRWLGRVANFRSLIAEQGPGRHAVLVADLESYAQWAPRLPRPSVEDSLGNFVYAEYTSARD
ncbi:MAG TPA: phospholipid carrier-dependent glycosyltransferase [Myxococcota bacterium]|nr:phospholipid carrier-dependent glycosyltransferase [Myxococcota bacterium]